MILDLEEVKQDILRLLYCITHYRCSIYRLECCRCLSLRTLLVDAATNMPLVAINVSLAGAGKVAGIWYKFVLQSIKNHEIFQMVGSYV